MMRVVFLSLLVGAGLATPATGQDRREKIGDWTLEDLGSKPGDDSDRSVRIFKSVPNVDLSYGPSESNTGGAIQMKFGDCIGLDLSSGFGFDDPPADRAAQVRKQVHDAFIEFTKSCRAAIGKEALLMTGFNQAFAAVEKRMAAKPFTYPPEPPSTGADSAQANSQGN